MNFGEAMRCRRTSAVARGEDETDEHHFAPICGKFHSFAMLVDKPEVRRRSDNGKALGVWCEQSQENKEHSENLLQRTIGTEMRKPMSLGAQSPVIRLRIFC